MIYAEIFKRMGIDIEKIQFTKYGFDGENLTYLSGHVPSGNDQGILISSPSAGSQWFFVTLPSGDPRMEDFALISRSMLGMIDYPMGETPAEVKIIRDIRQLITRFYQVISDYYYIPRFELGPMMLVRPLPLERKMISPVEKIERAPEKEIITQAEEISDLAMEGRRIQEVLFPDLTFAPTKEEEEEVALVKTLSDRLYIEFGIPAGYEILDYVILDKALALAHAMLHPRPDSLPYFKLLMLRAFREPANEKNYYEKRRKIMEIYKRARAGEGKIFKEGEVLETPVFATPDENSGLYALIRPVTTPPKK
jgi:hypothetical protein